MTKSSEKIVLPALRGIMGKWVYYSCLMGLDELSTRVNYAREIHNNTSLSDMIQRRLTENRSKQIAEYLQSRPERFFSSLVVATYGGDPNWHAISRVRNNVGMDEFNGLAKETLESVGFLTFSGDEKLFVLDGQHRLAGIKKVVNDGLLPKPYDEISVIFVGHRTDQTGLQRTRRLFTTLNKTARPVSKGDIIALDEDDVMAICVRRLVEETELFSGTRIAFVAGNNMPVANVHSLTTIGNLYDVLTILFTRARSQIKKKRTELQRVRPDDRQLDMYFQFARNFFRELKTNFEELELFFSTDRTESVIRSYRGSHGGSALFRPIGLELFSRIIATLSHDVCLEEAVLWASKLPRDLNEVPFKSLMWDPNTERMLNGNKVILREILLYMLGKNSPRFPQSELLKRYRRVTGNSQAELPAKLV